MIKNVLIQIENIGIFPIVGLMLFFTFFIGMLIWVSLMKKSHVKEMSLLPLDSNTDALSTGELNHD